MLALDNHKSVTTIHSWWAGLQMPIMGPPVI